jgi:hypothetical protein
MSKRKTLTDYRSLAQERGFKYPGKALPQNVLTKTSWQCTKRHTWQACYHDIQKGSGCPKCVRECKRKGVEDYDLLAQSRGFIWTGDALPTNVLTKTSWQCNKGHSWDNCYNNIQLGSGCRKCSSKRPKEAADYHELAQSRGFTWTGDALPQKVATKTSWQCKQGHNWQASYHSIWQGTGCPQCFRKRRSNSQADYCVLANARGFTWTGDTLPANSKTKTGWQCKQGHSWNATYNNIQQGTSCPQC